MNSRQVGELPSYTANDSKIVADRKLADSLEHLDMLRGFGFSCEVERHAGFWLIHYKFPKLRLVGGNVVNKA